MDRKSKIILISGSTASGKSKFSVKLAKKLDGEIINTDSMQVFKEIKILNARPFINDQKKIIHHLYGIISVKKNFSTGEWLKIVKKKITTIKRKNKIVIFVGGTGLYFKALTEGLVKIPFIPSSFRNKIRNLHKKIGQKEFYKKLLSLDPLIKSKINFNDSQRSIRAYEVKKYTKISLIKWYENTDKNFHDNDFLKIYLDCPRPDLIKRIDRRVEKMFSKGAISEVKKFLKLKVRKDNSSNKIIGISEIAKLLKGEQDLRTTKELIAIKTRQYAKRQRTWARSQMTNWVKVDYKDSNSYLKKIKISSLKLDL